jgi:hypothetical protein
MDHHDHPRKEKGRGGEDEIIEININQPGLHWTVLWYARPRLSSVPVLLDIDC